MESRFWLLNVAYFFAMVGTICFFIIYKDFAVSKGVGDYYTMALSGIGIGDLVGRMSTGIMLSSTVSVHHHTFTQKAGVICEEW